MSIREIVIYLYVVAFLISLLTLRGNMTTQDALVFGFYALVGICGIMLANWVHTDEEEIKQLKEKVDYAYKMLYELEKSQKA